MTSRKDQKQYWARKDQAYSFVSVNQFAEAFLSFHVGQRIGDELSTPFNKAKSHPAALERRKYGVGKMELFKACLSRELLLMKRNSFVYALKLIQVSTTGSAIHFFFGLKSVSRFLMIGFSLFYPIFLDPSLSLLHSLQ